MSNTKKAVAVVALGGMLGFGGCLGMPSLADLATYTVLEYAFDNDGGLFGFDVFQDDFGTSAEYDDRFTADASREEVDAD